MTTFLLARLDRAVQAGLSASQMRHSHDELLYALRKPHTPAPDWDTYPAGRDFWLQHYD